MAKRRNRKSKSNGKSRRNRINLWTLGTALLSATVVTQSFFNATPRQFFLSWPNFNFGGITPTANSSKTLTLYELLNWDKLGASKVGAAPTGLQQVGDNVMKNLPLLIGGLVGVRFGSRIIRRQLAPFINETNKVLKVGGIREVAL
jgi:hypothetical protein